MVKIYEDAQALADPRCASEEKEKMQAATRQVTNSVKAQVEDLKKSYKKLVDLIQQKKELFIICVKFHMMTRQVSKELSHGCNCDLLTLFTFLSNHLMKVQKWKDEVLEFLASLYLEEMSQEEASASFSKIEDFDDDIQDSQLETIAKLANSLPTEKHFKKVAENVKEK